jgi:cation-transporting P-type ATPase I
MSAMAPEARIVHSLPGRLRMHMAAWDGRNPDRLAAAIARVPGVSDASANSRTRNVLARYDQRELDEPELLATVARAVRGLERDRNTRSATPAPGVKDDPRTEGRRTRRANPLRRPSTRARIAVRGMDRDPELARRVVESLESHPHVDRAVASVLTARVLVEFSEELSSFDELIELIAELEPPDAAPLPAHPLDPGPLIEATAKTVGSLLGLGLLAARRGLGAVEPPVAGAGPGEIAASLGLVDATPSIAHALENALGYETKELMLGAASITALTFSGSALGLTVAAASALRMVSVVRQQRSTWRNYEDRADRQPRAYPGHALTLAAGDRAPLPARVLDGTGVAAGADGLPVALRPGSAIPPGARIYGGPVRAVLSSAGRLAPEPRPEPRPERSSTLHEDYLKAIPLASAGYAALSFLLTRSPARALTALLLVNPRPALAGEQAADRGAAARAMRCGLTIAGSRPNRPIRRPDVLLVAAPRVLTDGWTIRSIVALGPAQEAPDLSRLGSWIAVAAGSPWGATFLPTGQIGATHGVFDGEAATAEINGERWSLAPLSDELSPEATEVKPGDYVLALRRLDDGDMPGVFVLRPRVARGVDRLVDVCARHSVRLEMVSESPSPAVRALAERVRARMVAGPLHARVEELNADGRVVGVLADSIEAAAAFDACDLAVGLSSGRAARFQARADLLAPSVEAAAALLDAGARRDQAVRDAVACSMAANAGGAVWGLLRAPAYKDGPIPGHLGSLAAMGGAWLRLRGGRTSRSVAERISDPLPERWARVSVEALARDFQTRPTGLTTAEAAARREPPPEADRRSPFLSAVLAQLNSPVIAVLGAGAALSLGVGALADVAMIGAVVAANAVVGTVEENEANLATEALSVMSPRTACVLRDGQEMVIAAGEVVPGDVIVLGSGERVAADARLIDAQALEVDEAALTGESFPVSKSVDNSTESGRIVLEGSDVTTGTGRAIVVAVGAGTRLGSLASVLADDVDRSDPMHDRLAKILWRSVPLIATGGAIVTLAGILRRRPLLPQLMLGATVAIAAVPEGLPLLASVAEAGVARRLARRRALVTRLAAVEALGRVDVACADKTGTLTEGRLTVSDVATAGGMPEPTGSLSEPARDVLLSAALASPHPDAADALSHPTDAAVIGAARDAGLGALVARAREAESPFDPVRSFHAAVCGSALHVKGATEVILPRCSHVRTDDGEEPLEDRSRRALLDRAEALAAEGRRLLMVARASSDRSPEDPHDLTALGFVGISDPIKPGVRAAVQRCAVAGVGVIVLTGDHPATARAIAQQAGLLVDGEAVLLATQLAELDDEVLQRRLERTAVIARTTPLDKVRIVQALQRRGHVVAMTGDGVNDAPALRLADVGVAMGRRGTDVAREAADLVLSDDDFSTLAEALVEGRAFWRNMRRALGLLLGGNAGEVGLMVGAGIAGLPIPLTTRQVLSVNLVTDVLPAVAVAAQEPEHRNLAGLRREGASAFDSPLRDEIVRRGVATAAPTLAAYALASSTMSAPAARTVAYTSIVTTQLGQTLDLGRVEAGLTGPVIRATVGSLAVLAASLWLPPLPAFLGLAPVSSTGLGLAGGASLAAVVIGRSLPLGRAEPLR